MYSLKSIVALSLLICCWSLLVDIRPSFAMPIEGDESADNYQDMYKLITQRLQNLTQSNQENDENSRRSFVLNKTLSNKVTEKSPAQNFSNMNLTTVLSPISNLTQVNQTVAENNRRSFVPLMAKSYAKSPLTGNVVVRTQLAGTTVSGNLQKSNSSIRNTTEGNSLGGNSVTRGWQVDYPVGKNLVLANDSTRNISVGNKAPVKNRVGILVAGNRPVDKSYNGSQPGAILWAGNPSSGSTLMGSSIVRDKPVANVVAGDSHVSRFLTNAEHTSASVFPNSYNAGPSTVPEDRSGIYTNLYGYPSTYDKKDAIYRQASTVHDHSTLYNHNPTQTTGAYRNYQHPGNYPWSQYSHYTGYPGYVSYLNLKEQQTRRSYLAQRPDYLGYPGYVSYPNFKKQQTRRGYLARRPSYQVGYPRALRQGKQVNYSTTKQVHTKYTAKTDVQNNKTSNKTVQYSATEVSSNSNTIQEKFPDNPSGINTPSLFDPLSRENMDAASFGSSSGSGFEEPVEMGNEADFEEPRELITSGSGDESGDLNTNPVSDVAFMLAGTNHKLRPLSVAGLPKKLTRKQALDIYKSAMYFAGLMKEDNNVDSSSEQSDNDDTDNDDNSEHPFTDEDDDDVTITDNDVKEALAASSGELYSSGQEASDVEASGSQLEAPVKVAPSTGNDMSTGKNEAPKESNVVVQNNDNGASSSEIVTPVSNEVQKQASEPSTVENKPQQNDISSVDEKVESDTQPQETSNSNNLSQASPAKSSAPKEESQAVDVQTKEDDDTDTPPPLDTGASQVSSYKQTSDSRQLDLNTPPSDETLMKETQANYAADQQAEQVLSKLLKSRQRGVYSSPTQRAVICKDTTQKIFCPPNQKIRILNADYGDTGNVGCLKEANPMPSGPCRTPGAYETVKRDCEGFDECELSASNDVFGDACPDSNKYLDVNYDCVNNAARKKYDSPPQDFRTSSPGLRPIVPPPQSAFQVPYAPPVPAYGQASYQPAPQYVNPVPPPVAAYAPAPYQEILLSDKPAPPAPAYAPSMGLPDIMPPNPYVAPDPCNPCNTCAQCSLQVCSPCAQTCQPLSCPPRIPAKLQPLWQQWNERTADMSRMEMAALIISPLPKLSLAKASESTESSGAAEGSESGEPTLDEDALYEASKRSKIQRIMPQKKSKKTTLKTHGKNSSDQEFLRNGDLMASSGDASSGSST